MGPTPRHKSRDPGSVRARVGGREHRARGALRHDPLGASALVVRLDNAHLTPLPASIDIHAAVTGGGERSGVATAALREPRGDDQNQDGDGAVRARGRTRARDPPGVRCQLRGLGPERRKGPCQGEAPATKVATM
jgi:hypothetical protein